ACERGEGLADVQTANYFTGPRLLAQRKLVITLFAFPTANYVPPIKIIRCFRCQKLGHYAQNCNKQVKCSKCSGPHSIDKCSSSTEICPNCGDNHRATYSACKVRLVYINELKNKQFPSIAIDTSVLQQRRPYASIAKPQSSQASQLINKNDSINEEILKQVSSVGITFATLFTNVGKYVDLFEFTYLFAN
ncbi:unnamed protein product, partial [Didymodactylos carnosus]